MREKFLGLVLVFFLAVGGCARETGISVGRRASDPAGMDVNFETGSSGAGGSTFETPYVPGEGESYDASDSVYLNYGPLIVAPGERYIELAKSAWSGYWLPSRGKYLFEGAGAPLRLWDSWIKAIGLSGMTASAGDWEQHSHESNPGALTWEGACDAWAIAALYEPEPTRPLEFAGRVKFNVGAQKSLLIKAWEEVEGKRIYGMPFRGDRESRWDDPSPAAFHRFLISELFEGERPFILDKDPGIPVWNTPIHGAAIELRDDPESPRSILVHTWLKGVDPLFSNPDEVGSHITVIELVYRLSGKRLSDGALEVQGGAWMDDSESGVDSREFHPDFLVGLPPKGQVPPHRSQNPGLSEEALQRFRRQAGFDYLNP